MWAEKNIKFIVIRNPLVPDNRLYLEREWVQGQSLYDYIGELQGDYAISRNGLVVEQSQLADIFPEPGDAIAICPMMHGGGNENGGKTVMRIVAIVALTIFTYGAGGAYFTAATGLQVGAAGAAGVVAAAAQAAVMIGGTLLINALLPLPTPEFDNSAGAKDSYSYGIDGPKNSSKENIPVPLIYGRHRMGGNIIGNHTELYESNQYLHMLLNLGEGVIAGVDPQSIQVNDQPINTLTSAPRISLRYGGYNETAPAYFNGRKTPRPVTINPQLTDPKVWTSFISSVDAPVSALQANFTTSLFKVDDNGNGYNHGVYVELMIRKVGTSEWQTFRDGLDYQDVMKGYVLYRNDERRGKPVVKKQMGVQYIDPDYPNRFIAKNPFTPGHRFVYKNHYVYDHITEMWVLEGDSVQEDGKPGYWWSDGTGTDPVYVGAPLERRSPPQAYAYGLLYIDGDQVGWYHDFHLHNKMAPYYNYGRYGGPFNDRFYFMYNHSTTDVKRYSLTSHQLDELGRYELRARRLSPVSTDTRTGDSITLNEVVEMSPGVPYRCTACMGIRLKVTDQLSSIPKITFDNLGRVIRVWDEKNRVWVPSVDRDALIGSYPIREADKEEFPTGPFTEEEKLISAATAGGNVFPNSLAFDRPAYLLHVEDPSQYKNGYFQHNNPAWIAIDILTDKRAGAGLSIDRLDFWAFKQWANYCEENKLYFNGVIETTGTVWDTISGVFKVGRAVPLRMGTRYSVSVEKAKQPVMRFGQDNIVKDSFSTNWLPMEDRANEIELTYFDRQYDYRARTIKVYDKVALANGVQPNKAVMTVRGITDADQATREAIFTLNINKLVQMVSFSAPIESLACTVGDVIKVQHNMMDWGLAGKLASVVAQGDGEWQLTLDQDFTFTSGNDWQMMLSLDAVNRGSYQVHSVYGHYVTLNGFNADNLARIKRLKVDERDLAILDTFKSSNGEQGVVLESAEGISAGKTVTLFDTDVLDYLHVEPLAYDSPTSRVTVTGLSEPPKALQGFMIGYESFESRDFTVRSIGLTGNSLTRQITALEYDERVFNDRDSDFTIEDIAPEQSLGAVTDVDIYDMPYLDNVTEKVKVRVTWLHSSPRYQNSSVLVRVNSSSGQYLGEFQLSAEVVVERGQEVEIVITPRDIAGNTGAPTTIMHTAEGGTTNSFVPINPDIESIFGGAKLSWTLTSNHLSMVEVLAIKSGTMIDEFPIDLLDVENLDEETVLTYAQRVGSSTDTSFIHIIESDQTVIDTYYYWLRSLDLASRPSALVFAGNNTPNSSISYAIVTVYQWGETAPAKPTGGSYNNPRPDQAQWSISVPPIPEDAPHEMRLWQSTRRYASLPEYSDESWSVPSTISNPGDLLYTWIAYAADNTGTHFALSYDPAKHFYVGVVYNQLEATPSTDYHDYQWSLMMADEAPITTIATGVTKSITDPIQDNIAKVEGDITTITGDIAGLDSELGVVGSDVGDLKIQAEKADQDIQGVNAELDVARTALESADAGLQAQADKLRSDLTQSTTDLQVGIDQNQTELDQQAQALEQTADDLIRESDNRKNWLETIAQGGKTVEERADNLLIKGNIKAIEDEADATRDRLDNMTVDVTDISDDIDTLNQNVGQLGSDLEATTDHLGNVESRLHLTQNDLKVAIADIDTVEGNLSSVTESVTVLESETEALASRATALEGQTASLTSELKIVEDDQAALALRTDILETDSATAKADLKVLESEQQALASRTISLETETASIRSDMTVMENDITTVASRTTTLETDNVTIRQDIRAVEDENASLASRATTLETETASLGDRMTVSETAQAALVQRTTSLETETASIRTDLTATDDDVSSLASRTATLETDNVTIHDELTAAQNERGQLAQRTTALETDNVAIKVDIKAVEDEQGRLASRTTTLETDTAQLKTDLSVVEEGQTQLVTKTDSLSTEQAAIRQDLSITQDDVTTLTERTVTLETDSAQAKDDLRALETEQAALAQRTITLETNTASISEDLTVLEGEQQALAARTTNLETESGRINEQLVVFEGSLDELGVENLDSRHDWLDNIAQGATDVTEKSERLLLVEKVTKVEGNVGSVTDELRVLETETDLLAQRVTTVEGDTTRIEDELAVVETDLSRTAARTTKLEGRAATAESRLEIVESDTEQLAKSTTELKTETAGIRSDMTVIEDNVTAVVQKTDELTADDVKIRQEIKAVSDDVSDVASRTTQLETDSASLTDRVAVVESDTGALAQRTTTLETDNVTIKQDIGVVETELSQTASRTTTLETATGKLRDDLTVAETELGTLANRTTSLETDNISIKDDLSLLENEQNKLANRTTSLETTTGKLSDDLRIVENTQSTLISKTTALEGQTGTLTNKMEVVENTQSTLVNKTAALETDTTKLQDEMKVVQGETESLASRTNSLETENGQISDELTVIEKHGQQTEDSTELAEKEAWLDNIIQGGEQSQSKNETLLVAERVTRISGQVAIAEEALRILESNTATLAEKTTSLETLTTSISEQLLAYENETGVSLAKLSRDLKAGDAAVLEETKTYTDSGTGTVLATARKELESGDAKVLGQSKTYTDNTGQQLAEDIHTVSTNLGTVEQRVTAAEGELGTTVSKVETLTTETGQLTNRMEVVEQDNAVTAANWQVVATVDELTSAIGMVNDGVTSEIYAVADKFKFTSTVGGTPVTPFSVAGDTIYAKNLVLGVGSSVDYDQISGTKPPADATNGATSEQIDAINNAQGTANNAQSAAEAASNDNITKDQLINSGIYPEQGSLGLKSENYDPNVPPEERHGWAVDHLGKAEFLDATIRGTVYATDGVFEGSFYAAKMLNQPFIYTWEGRGNPDWQFKPIFLDSPLKGVVFLEYNIPADDINDRIVRIEPVFIYRIAAQWPSSQAHFLSNEIWIEARWKSSHQPAVDCKIFPTGGGVQLGVPCYSSSDGWKLFTGSGPCAGWIVEIPKGQSGTIQLVTDHPPEQIDTGNRFNISFIPPIVSTIVDTPTDITVSVV